MKGLPQSLEELAQTLPNYIINLNDFDIGKKIGHGGFSEVFIGRQKYTGMHCAIKKLNTKELKGDSFIIYAREVKILADGCNLFLLKLIGFTTTYPFTIVTQYAPRGNLYDALHHKSGSPILNGTQKTIIALGIAYGMHRLHKIAVIHRDIKSLNILLDENCLPKICDFGLSRYVNNPNSYLTIDIGTPHWMAPELFISHDYTNKVDVYSYAILLWELLTGTFPFQGLNQAQISYIVCHESQRPEIPKYVGQVETPHPLKKLIRCCWAKEPEDRPNFKTIYQQFAKKEVSFPGTDFSLVLRIVDLINKDRYESKQGKTHNSNTETKQNHIYHLDQQYTDSKSSFKSLDHQSTFNLTPLRDIKSPLFIQTLEGAEKKLRQFQSEEFFLIVKPYFKLEKCDALKQLLITVGKLIQKGDEFLRCFIQNNLVELLPFEHKCMIEPIYKILVTVFNKIPSSITTETIEKIHLINRVDPLYTLHLINIFTLFQPPLLNFWKVADLLIKYKSEFIQNKSVLVYLKLITTLIRLYDDVIKHRQSYIVTICITIIETFNGNACHTAYEILCLLLSKPGFKFEADLDQPLFDSLIRHLNQPEDINYVMNFLFRLPFGLNCVGLIPPLALNAKKSKIASALLILYADFEAMAIKLVETINILQPLPTTDYTIRLLMKVLKYQSVIDRIPSENLIEFLVSLLSSENIEVINAAATMQTCLLVKSKNQILTQFYDSKFLKLFFNCIVDHDNSSSWSLAIFLINVLMKNRYDKKLLTIFSALEKAIDKPNFASNCATTIVQLMIKNNEIKAYISMSTKFPKCAKLAELSV